MIKKLSLLAVLCSSSVVFADEDITAKEKQYQLPKCATPAKSIAIGKLQCKAASCNANSAGANQNSLIGQLTTLASGSAGGASFSGIGDGLADMLLTSLKATNCFDIQEREALEDLRKEMEASGKKLELETADFMISGSITSIGMDKKNTNLGMGFLPVLSAINTSTTSANLAMDIRVIDTKKAKVLTSKTFEANSEKSSWSFGGMAGYGGVGFGGALQSLKGTALEDVARQAIFQATVSITEGLAGANITERIAVASEK